MIIGKFSKAILTILAIFIILLLFAPVLIRSMMGQDAVNVIKGLISQRISGKLETPTITTDFFVHNSSKIELDKSIIPFKEIGEQLGEAAKGNNTVTFRGIAIFDANGDGKMDIFFPHSGRPLAKHNDENGVMDTGRQIKAKPCALFLNMGNDKNGEPQFKYVPDLMKENGNTQYVEEELLIENKYNPRKSVEDDPYTPGRIAFGTNAADFNGDGLIDLLVLNHHFGMPHTDVSLGLKVYPPSENIGRKKSELKHILTTIPPYLASDMKDGIHNTFKGEPEGRNSLFINMGDKDNDGIPEWKDMTEETNMHLTNWASASATIGDIDRDGDLDIYISNFIDPDFWGFGIHKFAGHPNELYINQLAETGKFIFEEQAQKFGVSGLHEEENLTSTMWDKSTKKMFKVADQKYKGKQVGAKADHSWVSQFVDFNDDGWLDLVVTNDLGNRLRIYENEEGKRFKLDEKYQHPRWNGAWMGIASGDLNGDGYDEILCANFGSQNLSLRNTAVFANNPEELTITAMSVNNYLEDKSVSHHMLFSYIPGKGLVDMVKDTYIKHSPYIAPDIVYKPNCASQAHHIYEKFNYQHSIASIEFSWGPVFFDIDNDSDLDIYTVGSLSRGNDDFLGEFTSGPGRLLVNESNIDSLKFKDLTLEYQVLDIAEMEYESNPPRRKAPGTNWHKRDYIYLQDVDAYSEVGFEAAKNSRIRDLFRMHENANGTVAADLNNDGFNDFIVVHAGGNNSNLPSARNLKVDFMGKVLAIPPPNKIIKAPTNFEEGPTFVYLNQGAPSNQKGSNYVKIILKDKSSKNLYGIGSKIIANDKIMRRHIIGGQSYSGVHTPVHIGLGNQQLEKLEIVWGSGDQTPQVIKFGKPIANQIVTIRRSNTEM